MIRLISNTRFAILKETSVVAYIFVSSTEFCCFQVNTSSVDVSWNPVPEEGFRGLPMGYQVSLYALWWRHSSSRLYLQKNLGLFLHFLSLIPLGDMFNAVWSLETTIVLEVSNISIKVSWKDLGEKKVSFSFGQGIEKKRVGKRKKSALAKLLTVALFRCHTTEKNQQKALNKSFLQKRRKITNSEKKSFLARAAAIFWKKELLLQTNQVKCVCEEIIFTWLRKRAWH